MRRAGIRRAVVVLALVIAVPLTGHADEGFWPFNRIPREAIRKALGVQLSDAWLARVQQASVRFPEGSGSFVSRTGLVLTNHHVSLALLQKLSTARRDLVKNGFYARQRSDEIPVPDLQLLVLQDIEDVTARVNAAITPRMASAGTLAARRAAIADIERTSHEKSGLESEVVPLFQGGQYHLYRYRKHSDVRLVFAPEFDIAFFGGDPDNFTFPRYCLDMTIWRVYEGGKPLETPRHLPWSTTGVREGDAVFTAGHPGQTQRLNTVAHLEFLRDRSLPLSLDAYTTVRDALEGYAARGAEERRQAGDDLFGIENALKSWRGQLAGLSDAALMDKKRASEQRLRARVKAQAGLESTYGEAWAQIASARARLAAYNVERVLFENGRAVYSQYFTTARALVRWATERTKPDGQRLPEFTETRKAALERSLASTAPVYPGVEEAKLAATLAFMQRKLGADHRLVQQVLAGKPPAARAKALVQDTRLGDVDVRKALFAGGADAVAASTDPFVTLARLLEPRSRELRRTYDDEVVGVERDGYARIAQAAFAVDGDGAYPDGTFTLRLSFGQVKGYTNDGRTVAPFTDIRGLYVRADEHGHQPPYRYPDRWRQARASLALTTPMNLVSTNDIAGGNSGSPLINARGQIVGLIFDGNIHSLPGYFVYDGSVNRAISVDARAMLDALRRVYKADALVRELTAAGPTSSPD